MKPPPNMDVPNLDAMNEEDLLRFASAADMLARYAMIKAAAMECRRAGNINIAMAREAECDTIYKRLPEKWKW